MNDPHLLDGLDLFAPLSEAERSGLSRLFAKRSVRRLATVYCEGTPSAEMFVIRKGWVELSRASSAQDRVFRIGALKPGDAFGIGEMQFPEYFLSAVALTDCELLVLSKEHFLNEYLAIPHLNAHLIRTLATVVRQRILMLDWDCADRKLVYFLHFLAERYGVVEGVRITISKKITQERIAEILDLSREHVVRLYRRLEDADFIRKSGSRLVISKPWLDARIIDKSFAATLKRSFFSELDALDDA
jgi:CRP/FNR family transcriptional regulator